MSLFFSLEECYGAIHPIRRMRASNLDSLAILFNDVAVVHDVAPGELLELNLRIVEARGLKNVNTFTTMSCFATVRVGREVQRTQTVDMCGDAPQV